MTSPRSVVLELFARDVGKGPRPANPGEYQLPLQATAGKDKLGVGLEDIDHGVGVLARLFEGIGLALQAVGGEQCDALAVNFPQGIEPPILDFEGTQNAPPRVEDHEVGVDVRAADGDVVPRRGSRLLSLSSSRRARRRSPAVIFARQVPIAGMIEANAVLPCLFVDLTGPDYARAPAEAAPGGGDCGMLPPRPFPPDHENPVPTSIVVAQLFGTSSGFSANSAADDLLGLEHGPGGDRHAHQRGAAGLHSRH